MARERIEFLGIPIDKISSDELPEEILRVGDCDKPCQVFFLSVWSVIYSFFSKKFRDAISISELVLPTSPSIVFGAKFLKKGVLTRYNPFSTIVSMIYTLNNNPRFSGEVLAGERKMNFRTLYLFGGTQEIVAAAAQNVKKTFPNIRIVGHFAGHFRKSLSSAVISAIHKSEPNLVLVGSGVPAKNRWFAMNHEHFKKGIFVWDKNIVSCFANRRRPLSDKAFSHGLEIWRDIIRNPLKIMLIFPFILYLFALLFNRLFKKAS